MNNEIADLSAWKKVALRYRDEFESTLVSLDRLSRSIQTLVTLDQTPCSHIHIEFRMRAPHSTFAVGSRKLAEPDNSQLVQSLDSFGTEVRISLWRSPDIGVVDLSAIATDIMGVVASFWKGALRSSKSWLISNENSERSNLIDNTFRQGFGTSLTAFLYCDLDNFKTVNDQLGHQVGDRIIREFGALVALAAGENGIAIHRSGDEFLILLPCATVHEPLEVASRLHDAVASHDFGANSIRVGVKVGVSLTDRLNMATYSELEQAAEAATVVQGAKQRGRARFAVPTVPIPKLLIEQGNLDSSLLQLKSGLGSQEPFCNPWLNLISSELERYLPLDGDLGETQKLVDATIRWIGPTFSDSLITAAQNFEGAIPQDPVFSHIDVAFAVAHAVYRLVGPLGRQGSLTLEFSSDGSSGAIFVESPKLRLYKWGGSESEQYSQMFALGGFVSWPSSVRPTSDAFKRAVLIKIGHEATSLPKNCFHDTIVVDDRPTRGGGLPDFWEPAIARLVAASGANPNVKAVLLLGNPEHARHTWRVVGDIDNWTAQSDSLSLRTGVDSSRIRQIGETLKTKTFRCVTEEEAIPALADLYRERLEIQPILKPSLEEEKRFLVRHLEGNAFALSQRDGCRARSIAQAFPLVLEIVRKTSEHGTIIDQAGQALNELVDFKVHLDDPLTHMVPRFLDEQRESLDEYYRVQFLSPSGLFGQHLQFGQETAVVRHVAAALSDAKRPFNTRRAILVVPHNIEDGKDLAPLGLVSIRIAPRISANRRIINCSFTWRTVEALIGFPYSLYGSVQYAHRLSRLISIELGNRDGCATELGFVSYIAHSLHFVLDQYAQNIARRVVGDASE